MSLYRCEKIKSGVLGIFLGYKCRNCIRFGDRRLAVSSHSGICIQVRRTHHHKLLLLCCTAPAGTVCKQVDLCGDDNDTEQTLSRHIVRDVGRAHMWGLVEAALFDAQHPGGSSGAKTSWPLSVSTTMRPERVDWVPFAHLYVICIMPPDSTPASMGACWK